MIIALYLCVHLDGMPHCQRVPSLIPEAGLSQEPLGEPVLDWLLNPLLSEQTVGDLAVLATIEEFVKQLSLGRRTQMTHALDDVLGQLDLPASLMVQRR